MESLLSKNLLPCPVCGGPAVNVAGEYITCGDRECLGSRIKAIPYTVWNERPQTSVNQERAKHAVTREVCRSGCRYAQCQFLTNWSGTNPPKYVHAYEPDTGQSFVATQGMGTWVEVDTNLIVHLLNAKAGGGE